MTAELCPTPTKTRFATLSAAQSAADRAGFVFQKTLHPYDDCPCGWIHLTSKGTKDNRRESLLSNGPVDDLVFALVVRDDVMGRCAAQDSEILRTPEHMVRWSDALKTFQVDLSAQMAERKGIYGSETQAWRKRMRAVERALREKRAEAKRLMYETYTLNPQNKRPKSQNDNKKQRVAAGDRALQRLKEAHFEEFMTYVAEEYIADGLPLKGNITQYTPKEKEKEKET